MTVMDWTFPQGTGDSGMFEIGRRLTEHIGHLPDATRFTYDPREMLRITRQIEAACRGGTLWVGFQSADKLAHERDRYVALVAAGTRVTGYGTGDVPGGLEGLDYRRQSPDTRRLANQWFLVSTEPEPIAFVSWELGDPALFGVGGAATPGKRFVGFVSDDPAVVAELRATLEAIGGLAAPVPPGPPPPPAEGTPAGDLLAAVSRLEPSPSNAPDGAVVVPVGRGPDGALALALAIALREERHVVMVDRGAEGWLGTPYGDLRGDDDYRPDPERLFGVGLALREGRADAVMGLEAAGALGLNAGGWFPTSAGGSGLGEALRRFGGTLLVVPSSVRRPGLAERLRGMSAERLAGLGVSLVIAD